MNKKLLLTLSLLLISGLHFAMAQGISVKGQVLDEHSEGIPGASVQVKGEKTGTITDADGNFEIEVSADNAMLIINALGFTQQEVPAGNGGAVKVNMKAGGEQALEETVVVGYGSETRKTLIGGSSIIKEKAFKDIPMGNFTNMLQGKATGVQITGQNGAPGAPAYIRIRGVGSITAGQEPLIVIDGVPATLEAYSALNPNDIADVSVLKDASTTAIYGSRGSNGVIMVSTKKGGRKNAPPQIAYGFQYGFRSKTPDNYKMMNFGEKLGYERALGYTNNYLKPLLTADGLTSIEEAPDPGKYWNQLKPYETNWLDKILRTGRLSQHDLSVSGSSERIDYFLSLQSYSDDGISLASSFKRKTGYMSVDYKATDWLKIGQSIRITNTATNNLRDIYNAQNPFSAMYLYNPYESPYDFTAGGNNKNGYNLTSQGFNVIEALMNNPASANTIYGLSATYLELTPVKCLTVRTQLGLQYSALSSESFVRPGSILDMYTGSAATPGTKTDAGNSRFNYVWTNTAEYKRTFAQVHTMKILVGTEFTKEKLKTYSLRSVGYPFNPDLNTQDNGATPNGTTTSKAGWTLFSMFARAEYNYAGKYLANVSIRRDGSSRFGKDSRYGNFVSGGLAWNLTEEDFLKEYSRAVNNLKLWGSVGTSGNYQIGNYDALPLYRSGGYNGQVSFFPNPAGPGNANLTWEKNTVYSVGLDFGFFGNRISGSVDYYNRYTHALLLDRPLSATTGYTSQLSNIGSMRNSGVELSLNLDVVRLADVTWSVGGNITLNKNRIVKLVDGKDIPNGNTGNTYFSVDKPLDVYYMQRYAGVDPENGNELWYKSDGVTTTSNYSEAGRFILDNKSPDPKYYGGFNTALAYKGIQLSVDFYYSGGNYVYNGVWRQAMSPENVAANMASDALDYWTPQNKGASNPRPDYNIPSYASDRWLQKGNFIRLRNVTLSYNLPSSLISKVKMQSLKIYVQGQNLWYSAPGFKGDPEVGIGSTESIPAGAVVRPGALSLYSYPTSRTITFGVNVVF
ncbi:SusC/RagA family TonB-linked outer membrane protein [Taibaiella helva]|uniref:SusC/RagA family TonB-linked outer membrane protein n=1 Tax=Taibaiella helva TaxID=2301235 RepID=UPI000E59474B|nr:TonB-dependent receptor [Taibaiella helva]